MRYKDLIEYIVQKYCLSFLSDTLDNIPKNIYEELCCSKFDSLSKQNKIETLCNIFQRFLAYQSSNIDDLEEVLYDFSKTDLHEQLYIYFFLDVQEDIEDYHREYNKLPSYCSYIEEHNIDFTADRMRGLR